jgi:hypothetical protein
LLVIVCVSLFVCLGLASASGPDSFGGLQRGQRAALDRSDLLFVWFLFVQVCLLLFVGFFPHLQFAEGLAAWQDVYRGGRVGLRPDDEDLGTKALNTAKSKQELKRTKKQTRTLSSGIVAFHLDAGHGSTHFSSHVAKTTPSTWEIRSTVTQQLDIEFSEA